MLLENWLMISKQHVSVKWFFLMPTFTLTKQIFALLHAGFVHLGEEDVQKMHMP